MGKVKIILNKSGVGQLLKSADMENALQDVANSHSAGWEVDSKVMGTRVIASIYSTDANQIQAELESHAITGGL